ncbi:predicted protein [Arabidopsis lyrata subsp. lyrata]|uniref:Predicted protein n=1 Tax=Arabidopsis lyrata subsp. lyrata TaxID=81972 RepID=D7KTS5_ARALL|nr:predicted protein [Arabidopsis lyrata subsp. lyrata]
MSRKICLEKRRNEACKRSQAGTQSTSSFLRQATEACLFDAYLSVLKALLHASVACRKKLEVDWVPACDLEKETAKEVMRHVDYTYGVLVPGGFGIWLGMKVAVIKFARSEKLLNFQTILSSSVLNSTQSTNPDPGKLLLSVHRSEPICHRSQRLIAASCGELDTVMNQASVHQHLISNGPKNVFVSGTSKKAPNGLADVDVTCAVWHLLMYYDSRLAFIGHNAT